jgi:hypothetical protein
MERLPGYDRWKLAEPERIEIPENHYRYMGKHGPVCTCDAYEFPHRPESGKCGTCSDCGFPTANDWCKDYQLFLEFTEGV